MSGLIVGAKISKPFCAVQSWERQRGFNHTMKYNLHQWVSASGCWYKHKKMKILIHQPQTIQTSLSSGISFNFSQILGSCSVCPKAHKIYKAPDRHHHQWHLFPKAKICAFYAYQKLRNFLCRFVFLLYFISTLWQTCTDLDCLEKKGTFIKKVNKNDKLEHAQLLLGKSDGGHKMQETR